MDMICRQPFLALQYFFQKDKTCASKTKESMQIISDIHHFMNDTNGSFRLLETRAASCMWQKLTTLVFSYYLARILEILRYRNSSGLKEIEIDLAAFLKKAELNGVSFKRNKSEVVLLLSTAPQILRIFNKTKSQAFFLEQNFQHYIIFCFQNLPLICVL